MAAAVDYLYGLCCGSGMVFDILSFIQKLEGKSNILIKPDITLQQVIGGDQYII